MRMSLILMIAFVSVAPSSAFGDSEPTVLITGSSRGIGYEFARQYAALGWQVIATCRRPETADALKTLAAEHANVQIEQLDVTDHAMIDALAAQMQNAPVDVLINNAGVFGAFPDQFFGKLDHDQFDLFMQVNAQGPLKMAEAFFEHLKAGQQKKIINITSLAGSFGLRSGGLPQHFWYECSKAALNMFTLTLADTVRRHGVTVVALSPGMVRTDRYARFDVPGVMEPEESIADMIGVIAELTADDTGTLLHFDGDAKPW